MRWGQRAPSGRTWRDLVEADATSAASSVGADAAGAASSIGALVGAPHGIGKRTSASSMPHGIGKRTSASSMQTKTRRLHKK
jgi:hypothetical protein